MKPISTIFAAALMLAFQGRFAGAHADGTTSSRGHCEGMAVVDYVSSDADAQTTSPTFVNITDGLVRFTTSHTGCVAITFSGFAAIHPLVNSGEVLHVQTLLDGSNLCIPAPAYDVFLQASSNPATDGAHSITRICKNVTAGAHSVQAQFHNAEGGTVEIDGHVLTVTHN
jgi:hypothetical protein